MATQLSGDVQRFCAVHGGKVDYVDRLPVPDLDRKEFCINIVALERRGFNRYVAHHAQIFRQPLFFEKMADWQQENEFRWIVFSKVNDDVFVDISHCLVGIVFGDKTRNIEPLLRQLPLGVQAIRLGWFNGTPWYDFTDLRCQYEIRSANGMYKSA